MHINANTRLTLFLYVIGLFFVIGIVSYAAGEKLQEKPAYTVVIEEDGSGVQYIGDREVATFPEDTFVWDCHTMGNRTCGK